MLEISGVTETDDLAAALGVRPDGVKVLRDRAYCQLRDALTRRATETGAPCRASPTREADRGGEMKANEWQAAFAAKNAARGLGRDRAAAKPELVLAARNARSERRRLNGKFGRL